MLARTIFAVLLLCQTAGAGVIFLGPTPYLSSADSPFDLSSNFYLEDFEDGELNTPGVTGNVTIHSGFPVVDSVDADDGTIDGTGVNGISAFPGNNFCAGNFCYMQTEFEFSPDTFGRLPNAVGIVWTDGNPADRFFMDVYGDSEQLVGKTMLSGLGDTLGSSLEGSTSEDRFLGAIYGQGIRRVAIMQGGPHGYLEFDHLQYGVVVPEPSAGWLLGISVLAILFRFLQGGRYVRISPPSHFHRGTP